MNVGYIKQKEMPFKIIDKMKYFASIVTVLQFEEGTIFEVPIFDQEKKISKTIKNLLKQMNKYKIDTVVISDQLLNKNPIMYQKVKEELYKCDRDILNGKKLMQYMSFDILKYILDLQQTDMKQEDIFFLIKKEDTLDLQFLSKYVENCKTVNIVTNDLERFKKIQENLYEKEHILISVSNNKSKTLKRAKYILNMNMDQKDLTKYKINREAIIINFKENVKYAPNTFSGININYFAIKIPDEHIETFEKISPEEFDKAKLYETILLKKLEIEKKKNIMISKSELAKRKNIVWDIINQDEIKITALIGNNGKIDEKEIIQKGKKNSKKENDKNLTKCEN